MLEWTAGPKKSGPSSRVGQCMASAHPASRGVKQARVQAAPRGYADGWFRETASHSHAHNNTPHTRVLPA